MSNKSSPKIKKPEIPPRELRGSLNSSPLRKSGGARKAVSRSYDEIAELSAKLDSLKKEYDELENVLNSMVNSETLTPFCQFKKWELEFNQRLSERDAELAAFSKYIGSFRKEPDPTFVEVDAAKVKQPRFDSITASLLVANPERTFFNNGDLAERNKELHALIIQQGEALNLVNARLKLFTKYQHANSAAAAVESLKKGEIPMAFMGSAPTKATELKTKKKTLSAELAALVEVRKELMAEKWQRRLEVRKYKFRVRMAVVIQRVVRGFLVRLRMKRCQKAATKIQSAWRGYIVRYAQSHVEAWGNSSVGQDQANHNDEERHVEGSAEPTVSGSEAPAGAVSSEEKVEATEGGQTELGQDPANHNGREEQVEGSAEPTVSGTEAPGDAVSSEEKVEAPGEALGQDPGLHDGAAEAQAQEQVPSEQHSAQDMETANDDHKHEDHEEVMPSEQGVESADTVESHDDGPITTAQNESAKAEGEDGNHIELVHFTPHEES